MSVLNDEDIERYCKEYQLMKHYDKKKIKYASYDLRVGKEYILASEEKPKELGLSRVTGFMPYTSALKDLDEKFERFRIELLSRWLPIMLVVITVIIMILTVIISFRVIN